MKLIGAVCKWGSWKVKGRRCNAVVTALTDKQENYKNKKDRIRYEYSIEVEYLDQRIPSVYQEVRNALEAVVLPAGEELIVMYDPNTNACEGLAVLTSAIKKNLLGWILSNAAFYGTAVITVMILAN